MNSLYIKIAESEESMGKVVSLWRLHAKGRPTIVFNASVKASKDMAKFLNDKG
jgi:superfamily II DNA or RNA helicase